MKHHIETWGGKHFKGRIKIIEHEGKNVEVFVKKTRSRPGGPKDKSVQMNKKSVEERNKLINELLARREKFGAQGIPVTKFYSTGSSKRGLMHANLEDIRKLSPRTYAESINDIIDIAKNALDKGMLIDITNYNFGTGADGKIKVRELSALCDATQLEKVIRAAEEQKKWMSKQAVKKINEYLDMLNKLRKPSDEREKQELLEKNDAEHHDDYRRRGKYRFNRKERTEEKRLRSVRKGGRKFGRY